MDNKKKSIGVKYFLFFAFIFLLTVRLSANFSKSGDVVTDNATGLMWQDNNETNSTTYTWQEAIDYCEALNLGGDSDWRVPNINELKTIIDRSKTQPAIVDGFEYVGVNNHYIYWSSTTFNNGEQAWVIYFDNGYVLGYGKHYSYYVRCVRDGE